LKIGLTGNIGCGKSTVSKIFKENGFIIIDADKEAKKLLPELIFPLRNAFGGDVWTNGRLNYSYIARKAFSSEETLKKLNDIVHPPLLKRLKSLLETYKNQNVCLDAALIYEWDISRWFDKIIVVGCEPQISIERMQKNGFSTSDIQKRWNLQIPQEEKIKRADFVIYNNQDLSALERQVKLAIEKIKRFTANFREK